METDRDADHFILFSDLNSIKFLPQLFPVYFMKDLEKLSWELQLLKFTVILFFKILKFEMSNSHS